VVRVHRGPPLSTLQHMEVRPKGARSTGQLIGAGVAWATVMLVALVSVPIVFGQSGWIIDIPIAVVVVVVSTFGFLYLRNERVGLEPGFLYRVNAIGLRKRWAISELSEVIRVQARTGGGEMQTSIVDADVVVNNRGRAVASFTAVWPQEGMTELWRVAELPISQPWWEPVAVQTVRKRFPGAIPTLPESYDESSLRGSPPFLALAALLGLAVLAIVGFVVAVIVAAEISALRSTH
jgi:hypothetical protein